MYLSIFSAIIVLLFLYFLHKKKVSFGIRVFAAMAIGIAFGIIFNKNALLVGTIGDIFIRLIKMLVFPLVTTSIISSITLLESPSQLKKIGLKTVGTFLFTAIIASLIGIIVGNILNVGSGVNLVADSSFKAREIPKFTEVILDFIPSNPIQQMAEGKVLPVIIFSMFIGIAIIIEGHKRPEAVKPVKDFIKSFSEVMFRVTKIVLKFTPYGVFGIMAAMSAEYGLKTLLPLGKVIVAVYLAAILHVVLTYGSLVTFVAKVNPLRFFKKILPVQVIAFTTRSSFGSLPVTLETLTDEVKVSDKIASFVAPLGATINMDGCGGLYPAISAIFIANIFNVDLTITHYILLIVVSTLASIGTAGVPGTASIMTTVVLTSLGLPLEGLAMLLGIDAILDMARTWVNVTGDTVTALVVANSEGEFDREAFNS
ncbi:sodium:dicarboxylate symporter family [Gottschalkia purinilytica]|uniref:Sodium:dicarboxylate symporter family n=1 Tax=Gottschalkia purinilytica TaxID=1503 RepID=A0A0L0W9D1_GOTPU|nr:dicarboxylate/amino acid:cation symporter [Gottschalkia purinilytica]KNF08163.1 sodium:dicarboxylate symporter family [Gottschalkia purinilytica]